MTKTMAFLALALCVGVSLVGASRALAQTPLNKLHTALYSALKTEIGISSSAYPRLQAAARGLRSHHMTTQQILAAAKAATTTCSSERSVQIANSSSNMQYEHDALTALYRATQGWMEYCRAYAGWLIAADWPSTGAQPDTYNPAQFVAIVARRLPTLGARYHAVQSARAAAHVAYGN